jgi:hypothetical protein
MRIVDLRLFGVFDAREAFFLACRDDLAVYDKRR